MLVKACAQVDKLVHEVAKQRRMLMWLMEKYGYGDGDALAVHSMDKAADLPAYEAADFPVDEVADLLAKEAADLIAKEVADLPADSSTNLPSNSSADLPSNSSADLPSNSSATPVKKAKKVFHEEAVPKGEKKGPAVKDPYTDPDRHMKKKGKMVGKGL